jgi:hypothetical protein
MTVRFLVTGALAVLLTASTSFAQTRDTKAANAATSTTASKTWTAEKTPWGDPDLQAVWSGDSAFGIPLQRPVELGTKAELTDQEFADKTKRDTDTRTRAENAVGSFRRHHSSSIRLMDGRRRSWPVPNSAEHRKGRTATGRSTARLTSPSTTAALRSASLAR